MQKATIDLRHVVFTERHKRIVLENHHSEYGFYYAHIDRIRDEITQGNNPCATINCKHYDGYVKNELCRIAGFCIMPVHSQGFCKDCFDCLNGITLYDKAKMSMTSNNIKANDEKSGNKQ